MRHLNYNHLLYFWTVAKEGSIAKATKVLHITPQTISGQLKLLEGAVGEALFRRAGRGLVLTETGNAVYLYADEIFNLGSELSQRIQDKMIRQPTELKVGVVNSIPKLIAYDTLAPALQLEEPPKMVCIEAELESLLADLAVHRLDLIISDQAIPSGLNVKAFNHKLGDSEISVFASNSIANHYIDNFPKSLHGAPMLLPKRTNEMRRSLEDWFESQSIRPNVVAEFEDSALLKAFGHAAVGLFPAPTVIAEHVQQMYRAKLVGTISQVKETYYAISPERKVKHPGVLKITEEARTNLADYKKLRSVSS